MCFYILAVFLLRRCIIMNGLFSVDLSKMNYKEIADWIISCRQCVVRENFDRIEDYYIELEKFCNEWENHSEANESIYKSEKYKKAIVYVSYRDMISFHFDFGSGKETINPFIYNFENSVFASNKIETELSQQFSKYYDKLIKVFEQKEAKDTDTSKQEKEKHDISYKDTLHDIILNQRFNELKIRTRVFIDNKWLKSSSYDEFLKECDKKRNYEVEFTERTSKSSYCEALEEYGVPKSVYNDFISKNKCEQEFRKKIFINLSFALSFPLSLTEKLLNLNGYTLNGSDRVFDIICKKAFFIGFSRTMTNDLIEKKNAESRKDFKTYKGIPDLNKNRK